MFLTRKIFLFQFFGLVFFSAFLFAPSVAQSSDFVPDWFVSSPPDPGDDCSGYGCFWQACDEDVKEAHRAAAETRMAYNTAVDEQIVKKPDSTAALTCFSQAAGASGDLAGDIFSGSFVDPLGDIINPALEGLLKKNFQGSLGDFSDLIEYLLSLFFSIFFPSSFDCMYQQDLWDEYFVKAGREKGSPPLTLTDILWVVEMPGGEIYEQNMEKSAEVFGNLADRKLAMPKPNIPTFVVTTPDGPAMAAGLCDILTIAGAAPDEGC